MDVRKLKGKIVEKGVSINLLADKLGVNQSTLYRRISDNGESFTIKEADLIAKTLGLTAEEVISIFFVH